MSFYHSMLGSYPDECGISVFRSKTASEALPLGGPYFGYPLRNWETSVGKYAVLLSIIFLYFRSGLPATGVRLQDLAAKLQQCYLLTTAGKFSEVISKLRKIIYSIPMLIVDSKQEVGTILFMSKYV